MADTDDELAALRGEVEELQGVVEALSMAVGALQQEALSPTKWWWPDMIQSQAAESWKLLVPWVDALVERQGPRLATWYRPCWYVHPAALDAMTALYLEHRDAYGGRGRGYEKANWINQTLPAMTQLIRREVEPCSPGRCQEVGEIGPSHQQDFIATDVAKRDKLRLSGDGEQVPPPDLDNL